MLRFIDKIPFPVLIIIALFLAIAPLGSEPHLVEKSLMLFSGTLVKPIDIFDLFLHSAPLVLLAIKLWIALTRKPQGNS